MQTSEITLENIDKNTIYKVEEINTGSSVKERLRELGLIPGTHVSLEHRGHRGEISSYRIRGAHIALRRETAGQIRVSDVQSETVDRYTCDACRGSTVI